MNYSFGAQSIAVKGAIGDPGIQGVKGDKGDPGAGGNGALSASGFGAKGDGTTDDTAALQAWLSTSSAGDLYLPPGVYKITSTLVLAGALQRIIYGSASISAPSTIRMVRTAWDGTDVNAVPILWFQSCYGVRLKSILLASTNRIAEGLRLTTQSGVGIISTRCCFESLKIDGQNGLIETGIRIGGNENGSGRIAGSVDANNDFHTFQNCSVVNYGSYGVWINDSQAGNLVFNQQIFQNAGWSTSASGAMTNGSTTLTHAANLFKSCDIGKTVEVIGAWFIDAVNNPLGIMRAVVSSLIDSTHTALSRTPLFSVGPTANIRTGPQGAIRADWPGFVWNGGFVGLSLNADVWCLRGDSVGQTVVRDIASEDSRRFFVSESTSLPSICKIENCRWTGAPIAAPSFNGQDPMTTVVRVGGAAHFEMNNCNIQDPFNYAPVQISLGAGGGVSGLGRIVNCFISSTLAVSPRDTSWFVNPGDATIRGTGSLFRIGGYPLVIDNVRLATPAGTYVIGNAPADLSPPSPTGFGRSSPRSGAVLLDFYYGNISVATSGAVTWSFAHLAIGTSTPMVLDVQYVGGSWAETWPASVDWGTAGAPAAGASGTRRFYELRYNGTTVFARVLADGFLT